MEQIFMQNSDIILRLFLAVILGALIGAERIFAHKEATIKTHSLVALGAAVFVLVSEVMAEKYMNYPGFNPIIMASQVIVGIGFLGAGSIMFQDFRLRGLTTAGGLWVTAGIGMAAGFGLFSLAVFSTIFVLIIFIVLYLLEKPIRKITGEEESSSKE